MLMNLLGFVMLTTLIFITVGFLLISFSAENRISVVNNLKTQPKGFWGRQFGSESTPKQIFFDWSFGVVLPVVCFIFDPVVFKGNAMGIAFLANYKPFAYLLSFVSVMALSAWLVWGAKLKWLNALLAGLFFSGGVAALIIGVCLIPFSVLGLIVLIGILGFTPLLTALVFLRNAVRAVRLSSPLIAENKFIYAVIFGALFGAVVPWAINAEIKKSLERIENGDAQTVYSESEKLKFVAPLVNFDNLVLLYSRSALGADKKQAISEVYLQLTGENIENKQVFRD